MAAVASVPLDCSGADGVKVACESIVKLMTTAWHSSCSQDNSRLSLGRVLHCCGPPKH